MEIKTKFNIDDVVYYIEENKIQRNRIKHIMINISEFGIAKGIRKVETRYTIIHNDDKVYKTEDQVFATKEDMINTKDI